MLHWDCEADISRLFDVWDPKPSLQPNQDNILDIQEYPGLMPILPQLPVVKGGYNYMPLETAL